MLQSFEFNCHVLQSYSTSNKCRLSYLPSWYTLYIRHITLYPTKLANSTLRKLLWYNCQSTRQTITISCPSSHRLHDNTNWLSILNFQWVCQPCLPCNICFCPSMFQDTSLRIFCLLWPRSLVRRRHVSNWWDTRLIRQLSLLWYIFMIIYH